MDYVTSACFLVLSVLLSSLAGGGNAEKAQALFVFGDSYADTGNHSPYNHTLNELWRRPYGFTWPGYPAGRYSSGKIQTDRWAEILGIPTPIAYQKLRTHNCADIPKRVKQGVNFAYGGSGVLSDYGYIKLDAQLMQFKELIAHSHAFSADELARSVVLISLAGNDYLWFLDYNVGTIKELEGLAKPVVGGIVRLVEELYLCGLRNFAVTNMVALGCLAAIGRTSCDPKYDATVGRHSKLLTESVQQLRSNLKGSAIIIPDLVSAYRHVFSNSAQYGLENLFSACCAAKGGVTGCAEVDARGRPQFEVCEDPNKSFFWDNRHPTEKGWHALMSLYAYGAAASNGSSGYINKKLSFVKEEKHKEEGKKTSSFQFKRKEEKTRWTSNPSQSHQHQRSPSTSSYSKSFPALASLSHSSKFYVYYKTKGHTKEECRKLQRKNSLLIQEDNPPIVTQTLDVHGEARPYDELKGRLNNIVLINTKQ